MMHTVRFSVSIPAELAGAFDRLIEKHGYANRSEAVRDLMRDYLVEREWESGDHPVVGTATIIYDHRRPELGRALTRMQHEHHAAIVCVTHVHLDEHRCMEVIVLRGSAERVQGIGSALIAARGVKHGKLVCTTAGENLP